MNYKQTAIIAIASSRISARSIEILGEQPPDWRVSLVDTGIWRNIGERLVAVRHLVEDEEIFLANYSDGLTDAPLPDMIDRFKKSGKIGCFIAIHPPFSFHLAEFDEQGHGPTISLEPAIRHLDQWRLFHFSQRDLRLHPRRRRAGARAVQPPDRSDQLMAYKYEGFWRAMDTLRDRQVLEEMVERGEMPWRCPPRHAWRLTGSAVIP